MPLTKTSSEHVWFFEQGESFVNSSEKGILEYLPEVGIEQNKDFHDEGLDCYVGLIYMLLSIN